jgi:hypothetical protein
MPITTAVAIFFLIWWVVLFAVLPWGIRSQHEGGEIVPGTGDPEPWTQAPVDHAGFSRDLCRLLRGLCRSAGQPGRLGPALRDAVTKVTGRRNG